ncbi:MAG: proteasome ATPase, partial [Actinomycetota bacterium]|nr:proteasome ATPase [Actinomycetota bacterium]
MCRRSPVAWGFLREETPVSASDRAEQADDNGPAVDAVRKIDSLTERNAKLLEILKDARQQLLVLQEEVDRLAQPPSGYGVFLGANADDTVDVFTSGRRMRLVCSPAVGIGGLKSGQTVRLNEALTVVESTGYERVGEVSALRELLDGGQRALVVGHADEERVVWLADPLVPDVDDPNPVVLRPG